MTAPVVLFEITRQCDRSCPYCYNPDRQAPRAEDLASPRLDRLLDRLGACGVEEITLIGGEPLTVPQLSTVVSQMARRGLRVGLSTNGLALDGDRIEELVSAGVQAFEVSLDSPDARVHGLTTGAPGVDRVRRALLELVQLPVLVTVGAMLTRHTVDQVDELLSFCFAIGVDRLVLTQLAAVGQARDRWAELSVSDEELAAVCALADARAAELDFAVAIGLPVEPCRLDRAPYPNLQFEACRCGDAKWVVEPNGDVRTCELAEAVVGNLLERSFDHLRRSEPVAGLARETFSDDCDRCEHWPICRGGCRFRRALRQGPGTNS
ncbi:MAG: radical SAM protein [Deltaproteobacteria bacterium]|jgi:radical SAM protein with 4Fe4S-binding SPASM domain|nr:radical SAM protein [Deltaproteobacteria bacterium]MBW2535628.1 radical SAM protein [Deltaproteobacteria bacterium]